MDVQHQIDYVTKHGKVDHGPKRVLIIGASGGYGLASRISTAYGCDAATIGVFFERPVVKKRTASAGWYKTAAFTEKALAKGLYAKNLNGDAFSDEVKQTAIALIKEDLGQVDMVVYSLAAPARQLADGSVVRSALKPIGESFDDNGTFESNFTAILKGPGSDSQQIGLTILFTRERIQSKVELSFYLTKV